MRRYDDPVEVRRGMVGPIDRRVEGPEQFLWRGKLWKVREVIAHWVETGQWWQSSGVRALIGTDNADNTASKGSTGSTGSTDDRALSVPGAGLLSEREMWRVEAGSAMTGGPGNTGIFDISFSWADGNWQLIGCAD